MRRKAKQTTICGISDPAQTESLKDENGARVALMKTYIHGFVGKGIKSCDARGHM